jgi:hypothetical protein
VETVRGCYVCVDLQRVRGKCTVHGPWSEPVPKFRVRKGTCASGQGFNINSTNFLKVKIKYIE